MKLSRTIVSTNVACAICASLALAAPSPDVDPATPNASTPEQERSAYHYNPIGKRDPFRPLSLLRQPAGVKLAPLSPLQRYEIGQLKLVGVVYDLSPPRAMVEDSAGLGFILTPGTPIGSSGGVVTEIRPRQVVVEEWHTDVIGEKHRTEVLLELPKEENELRP